MSKKAERFSTDAYTSDIELMSQLQEKHSLSSRKEAIRFLCNVYRGIETDAPKNDKKVCGFLSLEGAYCSQDYPKIVKTNTGRCDACLKAQEHQQKEREEYDLVTKMWRQLDAPLGLCDPIGQVLFVRDKLAAKDKEIEELRRPNEVLLAEKSNLHSELQDMKNALLAKTEEIAVLETDNVQLRNQIEELSHDSLLEKNAALTVQLGQKEQTVADLTSEIEKQEALIKDLKHSISDMTSRIGKMVKEFRQFQPSTSEPYELATYLNNVQKKIADVEGYLNTVAT